MSTFGKRCGVVTELLVTMLLILGTTANVCPEPGPSGWARNCNSVGIRVFRQLPRGQSELISPFGICNALASLYEGSRMNTKHEIEELLHVNNPFPWNIKDAFRNIFRHDNLFSFNRRDYVLNSGNSLFVKRNIDVKPDYTTSLRNAYNSHVNHVNFESQEAVNAINIFVRNITQDRLNSHLVSPFDDGSRRLMMLVNVLYFRGQFVKPFSSLRTTRQQFDSLGKSHEVSMMHMTNAFPYAESAVLQAKLLEMPLYNQQGDRLSIVFILPFASSNIRHLQETLTRDNLEGALREMTQHEVDISLPKFDVVRSTYLQNYLESLGVRSAFSNVPHFQGISNAPNLKLSDIIQEARITVSEGGIELPLPSYLEIPSVSPQELHRPGAVTFKANRPFLYLLRDRSTGTYLLLGSVVQSKIEIAAPTLCAVP